MVSASVEKTSTDGAVRRNVLPPNHAHIPRGPAAVDASTPMAVAQWVQRNPQTVGVEDHSRAGGPPHHALAAEDESVKLWVCACRTVSIGMEGLCVRSLLRSAPPLQSFC
jgi:hypothetical protein